MSANPNSTPGASAFREYEGRRVAREARVLAKHPRIGKALLIVNGTPVHERAWLRGAEGEQWSATRLERLLRGRSVELLHDRRIPHSRANIDHLAIGPGGVTVIDTKHLRGKVWVTRRGGLFSERREWLTVNGRDRTKLVTGVQWQMRVVAELLGGGVPLEGALCFVGTDGLPLFTRMQVGGVTLAAPRGVARIARRSGPLTRAQILDISAKLADGLRPA